MLGGWILWLSKDLTHPKDELKSFIEAHGGSVATRLSQKVDYAIARQESNELSSRISKYSIPILLESTLYEGLKTNNPFLLPHNDTCKENNPAINHSTPPSSPLSKKQPNPYNYLSPSPPKRLKPSLSIQERLQNLSLKGKPPSSRPISKTIIKSAPSRSLRKTVHCLLSLKDELKDEKDGRDEEMESGPPLQKLVFVICGEFSIARGVMEKLIVENGGRFVPAVSDEVTHLLFGGESVDVPEFMLAKEKKIHIVNEYFLRLLVKY